MTCSLRSGIERTLIYPSTNENLPDERITCDFLIKFHAAYDLPKMDIVGRADPYFRAKIDDGRIKYVSACVVNTSNPVWNEEWIVRKVPSNGKLSVEVCDKDDTSTYDDYIGKFQVDLKTVENKEIPILGPLNTIQGRFKLSIILLENSPDTVNLRPYTFDGPVRYARHHSLSVGHLTKINDERLYFTWEIYLKRIDTYFDKNNKQKWNSSYQAAKSIFEGPMSQVMQSMIKKAHRVLYAKTTTNEFGLLNSHEDFWKLLINRNTNKIKPCVYTYIIEDHTWRFSETGASFFVDFVSKHALHANCEQTVVYAGEFHPRPIGGWNQYNPNEILSWNQWELVIDNGSGTYAPDLGLLNELKDLLVFNFPNLNVITYDFNDPQLKSSIKACRDFAKSPKAQSIETIKFLLPSPLLH
ncbi:unnamed protein product [Rotaria sordida]|uniref:C2 domain-containing protein n=1 Tax=Rotaria sordida TaxID=392033 RepID=A0A814A1Y7_9BILA|nr:unnamed protein product [Rotaria sordida]CAF1106170.1 unnamed protein product [Rotaria sordida]CAF3730449.1 unnamed protein product [Rotaria sordida]CAF3770591.1 unnamed protein product [Rotaria sordida]